MEKRRLAGDGMVRKREDARREGRIVICHRDIDAYQDVKLSEESKMILSEWLDRWLDQMVSVLRPSTLDH